MKMIDFFSLLKISGKNSLSGSKYKRMKQVNPLLRAGLGINYTQVFNRDAGYGIPDTGYKIQDAGYRIVIFLA